MQTQKLTGKIHNLQGGFLENKILIILIIIAVINLAAAVVCAYDKQKAIWGGKRVSENMLMLLAIIGGATGMYITMLRIKHKTRHAKFMLGLPVIIIIQIALIALAVYRIM